MSLDQNLFTLNISARDADPTVVDFVDPKGTVHYSRRRILGSTYGIEVFGTWISNLTAWARTYDALNVGLADPLSESTLASVSAPSATSKHKTLQLHNPDSVVELKSTGTLSFKWSFKWEE